MLKKIIILLGLFYGQIVLAQQYCSIENAQQFQQQLTNKFADSLQSPLKKKDLQFFKTLNFYPVNLNFCVEAIFKRTPNEKPFKMKTTTNRAPLYIKYGEVTFQIKGKSCTLAVYQNIELAVEEAYKNDLFLPFVDLSSGDESYGGGRYIDLKIPQSGTIMIDFNRSYNPYCAYNERYSCPIPPQENFIDVAILAGVKKFHD